jgi:hypothetical protein
MPTGWHVAQDYSTWNSYAYRPTDSDIGSHVLQVWVKNAGSTALYDAWRGVSFDVTEVKRLAVTSLEPDIELPVPAGTTITWEATAAGGVAPVYYQFVRLDSDGWHVVRPYSTWRFYTWTPGAGDAGSHVLQVWPRSAGSYAWASTGSFEIR